MAKFKGVYCAECGCLLGVILQSNGDNSISNCDRLLCYLCANSLTIVADTLGYISPGGYTGCIENLPSENDLVGLSKDNENNDKVIKARLWYSNIRTWAKDIRDEHQTEKVSKLKDG